MTIIEFKTFIKESRKEFRELITIYLNGEVGEMKRWIKDKLDEPVLSSGSTGFP